MIYNYLPKQLTDKSLADRYLLKDLGTSNSKFPYIKGLTARYSAKGLTNEEMSKNPVWKDLTGNGYDLQMKNFAWGGMSGCGGYHYNFTTKWSHIESRADIEDITENSFVIKKLITFDGTFVFWSFTDPLYQGSYYIRITGLDTVEKGRFVVASADVEGKVYNTYIEKDGIYKIDSYKRKNSESAIGYSMYAKGSTNCNIKVEILPIYPDALVFDGVDDYSVCDNFPILTKEKGYTVVALRQWISNKISSTFIHKGTLSSEGAFIFEFIRSTGEENISSFGKATITDISKKAFSYQTSKSYNGVSITSGNKEDGNVLRIGKGVYENYTNIAIWELIILDHDATEEELTKIKNYFIKTYPWLFFDQAWTVTGKTNEDTDRATIANITGNGNNLVLSNFGFAGNSGYGEYAQNFNGYGFGNLKTITYTRTATSMKLDVPAGILENIYSNVNGEAPIGFVYNFNLKITGLKTGNLLSISQGTTLDNIIADINQDGVYNIKATVDDSWNQRRIYFWIRNSNGPETTLSIEQIPDHEGYLVTDGVDDRITSSNFTLGKKFTVVGENKILSNTYANAGIVKVSSFFVFPNSIGVTCYINRQSKGLAIPSKRLKSICSDGRIYYDDWAEAIDVGGNMESNNPTPLFLGYQNNEFTRFAFKNLAIYNNKTLSKEDCIKAYIYLQTLKAK